MNIPHDVLTAARIAGFEFETFIQEVDMNPDGNEASEKLVETIARAVAAERERCAAVAETFRDDNPFPTVYSAIAAAIRKGEA